VTTVELTDRQRELAEVALGIVAAEGMAAVTFRSVAAASGWSLGAVQKAFAAKDEMYAAMFATLRATQGVGPRHPPGQPTVQAWLTELVLTILPLDDRTRALTIQGAAFAERAAQDSAVGAAIATSDHETARPARRPHRQGSGRRRDPRLRESRHGRLGPARARPGSGLPAAL
jgi:AcrR family transcriptional regulator